MKVLIITDIFGKNYLQKQFTKDFKDVIVLDAYENKNLFFENEKEAYEFYIKEFGHDKYYNMAYTLCKSEEIDIVLGFSAGGSIAYRLACANLENLKKVISFYPSQIRNHLNLEVKTKISIVFAKKEDSFDTKELVKKLSNKNITIEISDYEHGFMNKKSKNYNEEAYKKYFEYIRKEIYETKN